MAGEHHGRAAGPQYERRDKGEADRPRDQRDEGARDRDRILYTSALRRLAGITQVVASSEGAIFHNRLTHTHEVAQIARRMAQFLRGPETDAARRGLAEDLNMDFQELAEQNELARAAGLDPEIAEAAALAHDLGHPPFGHAAESVLDEEISADVADGFEGNAQSFRVVTKLSVRRAADPATGIVPVGLNLTRGTLDAILKYPWMRDVDGTRYPGGLAGFRNTDPAKKWGAFQSEIDDFSFARQAYVADGRKDEGERCLEAEIMDWADDIAYAVHDVDDFFRAGLIPLDGLFRGDERATTEFWDGLERRWTEKRINQGWALETLHDVFDDLMDLMRHEPLMEPFTGHDDQRGALRTVTARLIRRYVLDLGMRIRQPDDENTRPVTRPLRAEMELGLLKELIWQFAILHPRLASQQQGKRAVITGLLQAFRDAATTNGPLLPRSAGERLIRARAETDQKEHPQLFARTATDVICSMTEQQAVSLFRRLTGQAIGSILDASVH